MSPDTFRRFLTPALALAGTSLAIVFYGAPPWPVVPLLIGISLFWWGSTRDTGSAVARHSDTRIATASERRSTNRPTANL